MAGPPPELTELFEIGGEPIWGPAERAQSRPAVAFDGSNYLVVWSDARTGYSSVYGARVTASGAILDRDGIRVSSASGRDLDVCVAFDGTNYLVVWSDDENENSDIWGARVSPSGSVLDPEGIAISTAPRKQSSPAMAFGGSSYLVTWEDTRGGNSDIYGARVGLSGSVLDPGGIALSRQMNSQSSPALAFDGNNYLVVWQSTRDAGSDIYGIRVNQYGTPIDREIIPIATGWYWKRFPAVAFDGTNYMVVFHVAGQIVSVFVNPAGVVDPRGIAVSVEVDELLDPALVFGGTDYFLSWADRSEDTGYDIYSARVSTSGSLVDSESILISTADGTQLFPALAFDGTDYLVVWEDSRNVSGDIYGARVSSSGSVLEPKGLLVSATANGQSVPSCASNGSDYLVVWEDFRFDGARVYGARVGGSGIALEPEGIAAPPSHTDQVSPVVASDGAHYLVAWVERCGSAPTDIYAARLAAHGVVLDSCRLAVSVAPGYQTEPDVAFDGANYLVVWCDGRNESHDIYGARVSASGVVLDPSGIAISTTSSFQSEPSVAFDGRNYLVVWRDWRDGTESNIYGARVSPSGVVLDPSGIAISAAPKNQQHPDVAWDGSSFLVVWDDCRNGPCGDIFAARVSPFGVVRDADGIPVSTASRFQYDPAVVFDGFDHFVFWADERNGSKDIYAARVNPAGHVLEPSGIPINASARWKQRPAVASSAGHTLLVAYSLQHSAPFPSISRIWGNLWKGPVSFSSVIASSENGCVTLSWKMDVSAEESDFGIERSETVEGGFMTTDVPVQKCAEYSFSFTDCALVPERMYWYKLTLANASWNECYGPVGIYVKPAPIEYMAHHCYPNPFELACTIGFEIPQAGRVRLEVFDVSGRHVRTLLDDWMEMGFHREVWDGRGKDGRQCPSGVYFHRLTVGHFKASRKMILVR